MLQTDIQMHNLERQFSYLNDSFTEICFFLSFVGGIGGGGGCKCNYVTVLIQLMAWRQRHNAIILTDGDQVHDAFTRH